MLKVHIVRQLVLYGTNAVPCEKNKCSQKGQDTFDFYFLHDKQTINWRTLASKSEVRLMTGDPLS